LHQAQKSSLHEVFHHILYYHVFCSSSSGYDPDVEDIRAGLFGARTFCKSELKLWVQHHAWPEKEEPTPFKSITTDFLRACNYALRLQYKEKEEIYIVVIDAWVLGPYNVIPCNKIRKLVGEEENGLFDTESLIWRRIPSNAIIARFKWADICNSLGRILPPLSDLTSIPKSGPKSGNRPLQALRDSLATMEIEVSELVRILLDDFRLFQCRLSTMQFAMMILGWTKGYSRVNLYRSLHNSLRSFLAKEIWEIDYRFYARECRQRQLLALALMPNGTESIESIENGLQLSRNFPIITLEEWRNERLNLEMAAFREACEAEPHADDLIPLLLELGFDVSPTPIRRYRIRILPSRATSTL
jgi:hypothetical protein